ncbi:hypothetical protein S83_019442, partial [Arachis hypogaea]
YSWIRTWCFAQNRSKIHMPKGVCFEAFAKRSIFPATRLELLVLIGGFHEFPKLFCVIEAFFPFGAHRWDNYMKSP